MQDNPNKIDLTLTHTRSPGFTLAEVLITLGIIGVLAAMTIPSLLQSQNDKATVVAVKKAYSIFSQAYQRAVADNGSVSGWDLGTKNVYDGALKVENYFIPYLALAKDCAANGGCFPAHYYQVSGIEDNFVGNTFTVANLTYATAKLSDGSIVAFWSGGPDQNGYVIIDINGEKLPNTYGRDTFWFYFDDKNFSPWSMVWGQQQPPVDNSATSHCDKSATATDANNGRTCTAWVLRIENLDYLRCSNLNWTTKTKCD